MYSGNHGIRIENLKAKLAREISVPLPVVSSLALLICRSRPSNQINEHALMGSYNRPDLEPFRIRPATL